MNPQYTPIQEKNSRRRRFPNIQIHLIPKALPMNPNQIKIRLPKNPRAIRSKNIPAAVHLPGTKQKQKLNIVPIPVPVLHLLPGTNQQLKNLHLNPVLLNLRPPGNPLVPKQ